jgi:hypothetical protein
MVEYAWPEALRPTRLTFYLQHNTTRFVSPITRQAQVLRREGARWVAQASFEPLDRRRGGILEGLLAALAGSLNTVRVYDWRREFRSGDPRSQGQRLGSMASSSFVGGSARPGILDEMKTTERRFLLRWSALPADDSMLVVVDDLRNDVEDVEILRPYASYVVV